MNRTTKITYKAIIKYGAHIGAQTFRIRQRDLLDWIEANDGLSIPLSTFQRHLKTLIAEGYIKTSHTRKGTFYTLPDDMVAIPVVKFKPIADNVYEILFAGVKALHSEHDENEAIALHKRIAAEVYRELQAA